MEFHLSTLSKIALINCLLLTSHVFGGSDSLNRLMAGNQRYVNDNLKYRQKTHEKRLALTSKQEPFAVIVGCSDSRVPPEIVFDQGIGDIFVVRVAGNVVGPIELDSIEYAALYLHSSVILVLGHENCGAVDAVLNGQTKDIDNVAQLITPAVEIAKRYKETNLLEAAIKGNAVNMRNYLRSTPVLDQLIAENKISVHAGYYNLHSGKVELLDEQ